MSVCAAHGAFAIATCERCGSFCCAGCYVVTERRCSACVARSGVEIEPVPWDERRRFFATWWRVIFRPGRTFARMQPRTPRPWRPVAFAALCLFAGSALQHIPTAWRIARELSFLVNESAEPFRVLSPALLLVAILFGLPLGVAALRLFVLGSLDLLLLRLFGCGRRGVEPSLRGACYSTAPVALAWLPQGWWVVEVWAAVLRIVAYRHLHENRGAARGAAVTAIVLVTLALYMSLRFFADGIIAASLGGMHRALGL